MTATCIGEEATSSRQMRLEVSSRTSTSPHTKFLLFFRRPDLNANLWFAFVAANATKIQGQIWSQVVAACQEAPQPAPCCCCPR
jgi:hypothetical protein